MMSAELRSVNTPSFAASKARIPEGVVEMVVQLALTFLVSPGDEVVMRVQFTVGDRHSIILLARTDPAWFQGG
jgi:hypothetical protein